MVVGVDNPTVTEAVGRDQPLHDHVVPVRVNPYVANLRETPVYTTLPDAVP
jgi:hypothetical protein